MFTLKNLSVEEKQEKSQVVGSETNRQTVSFRFVRSFVYVHALVVKSELGQIVGSVCSPAFSLNICCLFVFCFHVYFSALGRFLPL